MMMVALLLVLAGVIWMRNVGLPRIPLSHPEAAEQPMVAPAAKQLEAPQPIAIDRTAQVVVLGYHRFVEKVRRPDTEITPADFEAQMKTLKAKGIEVISLADFAAWRRGEKSIPPASAIIAIDDGYRQAYDVAWPILKQLGYPFAVFIYTDYVRGGPKSGGGSMSWEQLAELRDAGVEIESHTISHADLTHRKTAPNGQDYETWLWKELAGSKALLEQKLGIKVTAVALPYGRSNETVREVAARAGYEMIFTVNGGKLGFDTPPDALGRFMLDSSKPKIFSTAIAFDRGGSDGTATAIPSQLLDLQPADGAMIRELRPLIRANLNPFGAIETDSVALRISGIGTVPAAFDPGTGVVTSQMSQDLRPASYTAIVSARVDGRKLEARWQFTVESSNRAAGSIGSP
jgi:peptidoglycan/xylan/chitin deacetylase (PgdA/CDA1 family)